MTNNNNLLNEWKGLKQDNNNQNIFDVMTCYLHNGATQLYR